MYNSKKSNLPCVVLATMTPWEQLPRLRHQVARALSLYYNVLFIKFPVNWRKKHLERWSNPEPNITVWEPTSLVTIPWRFSAKYTFICKFESHYYKVKLKKWMKKAGKYPLALLSFDHRHRWLFDRELFPITIYFCNDDFSLFVPNAKQAQLVRNQMSEAANLADFCFVTSIYYKRILKVGAKAKHFMPGHDLPIIDKLEFKAYKNGDTIRIGFVGYIDDRIDFKIIERVVSEQDMEFHLVGEVTSKKKGLQLASLKKVFVHPPKFGEKLLMWEMKMDILVMPYDLPKDWANTVTTPNKTFAYLAAGKPIIVTSLPNLIDFGKCIVYHAKNPEEFVEKIRKAKKEDKKEYVLKRLEIANSNRWEQKINNIRNLIDK